MICGCSAVGDLPPPQDQAPPNDAQLKSGIVVAISDSHFAPPLEVSDVFRAQASSTQPWMVCIRSGASDEARRLTYSAFFGKDAAGTDGQYMKSRYSVILDNCASQAYHPFAGAAALATPSPTPEPKKHHKHQQ
jgi:hypothetical protein